jgi:hypothetical protein
MQGKKQCHNNLINESRRYEALHFNTAFLLTFLISLVNELLIEFKMEMENDKYEKY